MGEDVVAPPFVVEQVLSYFRVMYGKTVRWGRTLRTCASFAMALPSSL